MMPRQQTKTTSNNKHKQSVCLLWVNFRKLRDMFLVYIISWGIYLDMSISTAPVHSITLCQLYRLLTFNSSLLKTSRTFKNITWPFCKPSDLMLLRSFILILYSHAGLIDTSLVLILKNGTRLQMQMSHLTLLLDLLLGLLLLAWTNNNATHLGFLGDLQLHGIERLCIKSCRYRSRALAFVPIRHWNGGKNKAFL